MIGRMSLLLMLLLLMYNVTTCWYLIDNFNAFLFLFTFTPSFHITFHFVQYFFVARMVDLRTYVDECSAKKKKKNWRKVCRVNRNDEEELLVAEHWHERLTTSFKARWKKYSISEDNVSHIVDWCMYGCELVYEINLLSFVSFWM